MKTLKSYVQGRFHEAGGGFVPLVDPSTEVEIARASSDGIDFGAALDYARQRGRAALGRMSIAERASLLDAISTRLHDHRDELIALSVENTGTTRKDAKFDVDGGTYTLAHYAALGGSSCERNFFVDDDGVRLGRSARFCGRHLLVPLDGVAVHINAFNFPVWGFAEKAACALLAGMPVITKPATSTAMVAERCMEIVVEAGILPEGVLSMICGRTGDLLDRLGPQDVLAFTGSASTALGFRAKANLLAASTRVNIEADSLNAAVLGPDSDLADETLGAFLRDVAREMTQKTGQKCTAVRRILVPRERIDDVQTALAERLSETVVGDPRDRSVTMGPLATRQQLDEAVQGVARLAAETDAVVGEGRRVEGAGGEDGKGFFFAPTLLRLRSDAEGDVIHRHEVFGPVATLLAYDGSAEEAARQVARGGGSLVTSIYSDDEEFIARYLACGGSTSGRLYLGSEKVAAALPGSGVAMPQLLHGGPGRAGGGSELGGRRGLELYLQRLAVSGDRALIDRLAGRKES